MWLGTQWSWTPCYRWLGSPRLQHTITLSRHLHFGPRWDWCRGCRSICSYWSSVPTRCRKSAWKQMSLLNTYCQISACWVSSWRKGKDGWFWKQIRLVTCMIPQWEMQFLSIPGSAQSAMQILLNQSQQVSIPERFNSHCEGHFASPKPLLQMLSGRTPQLTGKWTMIEISPISNQIVRIMADIILHDHPCVRRWTRIQNMKLMPFSSLRAL